MTFEWRYSNLEQKKIKQESKRKTRLKAIEKSDEVVLLKQIKKVIAVQTVISV